jgi:prevent-host-death family protein
MIVANIHSAKTNLSKLIEQAEAGEEVVIARNGKPAVRLTPVKPKPDAERRPDGLPAWMGSLRGRLVVHPGFDEADADIVAAFEESLMDDSDQTR